MLLLDRNPPAEPLNSSRLEYFPCDVTRWPDLLAAFQHAGRVDVAVANAGVSEEADYFADTFDEAGALVEPAYGALDVNLRGVLNFTKLAISSMRRLHVSGSIVITSSATAYSPEHSLPVYSAAKLAVSLSVSEAVFLSLLLAGGFGVFFLFANIAKSVLG